MAILLKKIKASTLVETITAVTLLSLISGFAILIFLKVSSPASSPSSLILAQQHTSEMLDTLSANFIKNRADALPEHRSGHLRYRYTFLQRGAEVMEVKAEVYDNNGKLIYTRKRLFYVPVQ